MKTILALFLTAACALGQELQYNRFVTTPDGSLINGNVLTNVTAMATNIAANLSATNLTLYNPTNVGLVTVNGNAIISTNLTVTNAIIVAGNASAGPAGGGLIDVGTHSQAVIQSSTFGGDIVLTDTNGSSDGVILTGQTGNGTFSGGITSENITNTGTAYLQNIVSSNSAQFGTINGGGVFDTFGNLTATNFAYDAFGVVDSVNFNAHSNNLSGPVLVQINPGGNTGDVIANGIFRGNGSGLTNLNAGSLVHIVTNLTVWTNLLVTNAVATFSGTVQDNADTLWNIAGMATFSQGVVLENGLGMYADAFPSLWITNSSGSASVILFNTNNAVSPVAAGYNSLIAIDGTSSTNISANGESQSGILVDARQSDNLNLTSASAAIVVGYAGYSENANLSGSYNAVCVFNLGGATNTVCSAEDGGHAGLYAPVSYGANLLADNCIAIASLGEAVNGSVQGSRGDDITAFLDGTTNFSIVGQNGCSVHVYADPTNTDSDLQPNQGAQISGYIPTGTIDSATHDLHHYGNIVALDNPAGHSTFQGDGSGLTNITANAPTLIKTNFLTGTLYSNTYGRPIQVSASAALTTASVAGMVQLSLEVAGQVTNRTSLLTAIGVVTGTATNALTPAIVPAGGTWYFRNTSSGSGDSASADQGQILVF